MGLLPYTTYYVHNDIIVINVNPDGEIAWLSHVPKTQITTDDGGYYSSYLMMVEKDRINFVYNDHRKNAERLREGRDLKNMGNVKKTVAVIATVDQEGKVSYDQLYSNKNFKAVLVPKRSHQVDRQNVLLFGTRGSKSRFGKMSLK
ncbi:MAG: hypothetical protein U5L96_19525 [Owenweeksia sp.]|nr:hypothetical protein [Owenweeksia sp.]